MEEIVVHGARANNLKNITVSIPRNKFTVVTGLSGSGKSSLAFDTIFAEGQRRYMESMSSYARQFLGNIQKPDVDYIEGLSPTVSIDQKTAGRSPRSTVGTMSEIYDYLRLLFAKVGHVHCPKCGRRLQKQLVFTEKIKKKIMLRGREVIRRKPVEVFRYSCPDCELILPEIDLSSFSFNSPAGACPICQGLGVRFEIEPKLVVPNERLTLAEGAIRPWSRLASHSNWYQKILQKLAEKYQFSLDKPFARLPKHIQKIVFYGEHPEGKEAFEGVIANLERRYRETESDYLRGEIEKYMVEKECPACHGQRLRSDILNITVGGRNIVELSDLPVDKLINFFEQLQLEQPEGKIAAQIVKEIKSRLRFLLDVGLGYLTLDRSADTLAGGEAQRIRLATQLGSGLVGIIYILDEPSIGLHPRDQSKLLKTLKILRDYGNSVIVVEHDKQTMLQADWLIDIGPGAGEDGGEVIAYGAPEKVIKNPASLTGKYLSGKKKIDKPSRRRKPSGKFLTIRGAAGFNLKNLDVAIPIGAFVCVTGVSGSGKSSLISETLGKALAQKFYHAKAQPAKHKKILGLEHIDKPIEIDQAPIGRTPRSNAVTYTGIFTDIREVFAATIQAKNLNLTAAKFSFNLKGGRCETCRGDGLIKMEMHFLPDIYVTCQSCHGRRYKDEVLTVTFKDKNISDVLGMSVDEALEFFSSEDEISAKLKVLKSVGLGYLKLGQPATTLSGGEAQRIKLATELARKETGRTLYILDEPTTGLHFEDIKRLLVVLQALVDRGNTVIVIEHNLDVVKCADWVIDLGPEGGEQGGMMVAQGTPEKVASVKKSYTGQYLKSVL